MAQIRESISTSQAIQLVNDIIEDTEHEAKLVEFKKKYYRTSLPKIGAGYWRGFMKRNKDKIVNSVGKNTIYHATNGQLTGIFMTCMIISYTKWC